HSCGVERAQAAKNARGEGVATMAHIATAATGASPFVAELESKNLHPLWDRYQRITPIKPQPPDAPFIWRWREVEPLLQRSVGAAAAVSGAGGADKLHEPARVNQAPPGLGGEPPPQDPAARAFPGAPPGGAPPPAPPYRRGDPLRYARGRRGHHRQRPALRDE